MSHRHPSKGEKPKSSIPYAGQGESAAAREPVAYASQAQSAQSPATPPAAEEKATEDKIRKLSETVAQLRAELERANERILRIQAEMDNYRKRAARELEEQLRYANISLMRDLLPVLDNIQRAIESAEKSTEGSGLLEGVKMVAQQLEEVLKRHHCVKIEALHAPFDPHLHHAILQQPAEDHPVNTVIMVTQDGYQLHDRVVRPSQVIVSSNSTEGQ